MKVLSRLAQLLGLNAIPVVGVMAGGWSDPTALALYWCETVILTLAVGIRIHVHRRATRKRGHFVEKRVTTTVDGRTKTVSGIGHFGTSVVVFSLVLSLVNAIFLNWAMGEERLEAINRTHLKQGLIAAAVMLTLGLLMDMVGIRYRPFAWIRQISTGVLWRGFLVQLAIILGVAGARALDLPRATLLAFVALKLYTDIVTQFPSLVPEPEPEAQKRAAEEEERFSGRPIPFKHALIQRTEGRRR